MLKTNATVICLPGFTFQHADNSTTSLVGGTSLSKVSWRGGLFDGASFTSAWLTSNSIDCYVEGTDLSANTNTGDKVLVNTTAPYRLSDNFGSTQRSPVGLGTAVDTTVNATTYTAAPLSSFVALGPPGAILKIIDASRSQPGDLLVLTAQDGGSVRIDSPSGMPILGNIKLHQSVSSITLGHGGRDTLTLLYRAGYWLEVADSQND